jgi:hypothetical protein
MCLTSVGILGFQAGEDVKFLSLGHFPMGALYEFHSGKWKFMRAGVRSLSARRSPEIRIRRYLL